MADHLQSLPYPGRVFEFRRSAALAFPMKTKMTLAALAGLVLGVVAMWFLVARTTGRVFANQYLISVADQANVALHIRAGRQLTLLTNIEAALPSYALVVDQEFRGQSESTNALWMIRAYYERNQVTIPPEIRGILDSLPVKPPTSCQLRLRGLDSAAAKSANEAAGSK